MQQLNYLIGTIVVLVILYIFYVKWGAQAFGVYTSGSTQRYMSELTSTNERPGISGTIPNLSSEGFRPKLNM
jgi:hypothetical protein